MLGQARVRRIQRLLVPIRPGHAGAQVIGHQQSPRAAERLERVHVRVDPRRKPHVRERLDVDVGAEREGGHEQPRVDRLAAHRVGEAHRIPGPVDLDRLTWAALNMHRCSGRGDPAAIPFVEERVPVRHPAARAAVRDVLVPQQQQRHRRACQLPVDILEVRRHPVRFGLHHLGQQQATDLVSSEVRHLPEADTGRARGGEHRSHRVPRAAQHVRDAALAHPFSTQPQDLFVVDHRGRPLSSRPHPNDTDPTNGRTNINQQRCPGSPGNGIPAHPPPAHWLTRSGTPALT